MNDEGVTTIELSYTGEKANRSLWSDMAGDTDAVRSTCTSLLFDLWDVDERAAVWCDGKRFTLTSEDLDRYNAKLAEIRAKEAEMRENPPVEDVEEPEVVDEPQVELDAEDRIEIPLIKRQRL